MTMKPGHPPPSGPARRSDTSRHHPAAMDLDGFFGGAEARADDLVRQPLRDQDEDFALARSQRLQRHDHGSAVTRSVSARAQSSGK